MKPFVALLIALSSLTLLGCPDDKPAAKPAATAAAAAPKPAASATAKPAGGW